MAREYYELRMRIRGKYARIEEFAKALGMSTGTLGQKLAGKSEWKRSEIEKVAELLELTPDEILRYFFNI